MNASRIILLQGVLLCSVLLAGNARASEVWFCEDSTGHRYKASQNVPVDACRQLSISEIQLDVPLEELPSPIQRIISPGMKSFCSGRPGARCESVIDGEERGALYSVPYLIRGASASVTGSDVRWEISCERDKMNLRRSCTIYHNTLLIYVPEKGSISMMIGSDHFPGRLTSIRVGPRRFDSKDRGWFPRAEPIIKELSGKKTVLTRHVKWPYESYVDDEFSSYGLSESIAIAKWLLKSGRLK